MKISDNLVFAGGCALNSLANKKFLKKIFLRIFLFLMLHQMEVVQ